MLEKLSNWPTPRITKHLLIFSIILWIVVYPFLCFFFEISNYPVWFWESQLSFNGDIIKSHLKTMNSEEINLYRIAQSLDYLFMIAYGTFYFAISIILSRKFDKNSAFKKFGYMVAICGPIAACCDAIENFFIFLMIQDPTGFPNVWAIIHSYFALVKYILLFICFSWVIIAALVRLKTKNRE